MSHRLMHPKNASKTLKSTIFALSATYTASKNGMLVQLKEGRHFSGLSKGSAFRNLNSVSTSFLSPLKFTVPSLLDSCKKDWKASNSVRRRLPRDTISAASLIWGEDSEPAMQRPAICSSVAARGVLDAISRRGLASRQILVFLMAFKYQNLGRILSKHSRVLTFLILKPVWANILLSSATYLATYWCE